MGLNEPTTLMTRRAEFQANCEIIGAAHLLSLLGELLHIDTMALDEPKEQT
jgi:hypothetical protein